MIITSSTSHYHLLYESRTIGRQKISQDEIVGGKKNFSPPSNEEENLKQVIGDFFNDFPLSTQKIVQKKLGRFYVCSKNRRGLDTFLPGFHKDFEATLQVISHAPIRVFSLISQSKFCRCLPYFPSRLLLQSLLA